MRSNLFSTAVLAAAQSACSGAAEIPDTPDLTGLQQQYSHPTAVLDPASADSVLADMPELGRLAAGIRSSGYATRSVDEASSSSSKSDEDSALRIQGSIRITIRCPGDEATPLFDAARNGTMSFTIGVEENRIKRGVGGTAENCILGAERLGVPLRVEVDGPILFDLGRDLSIRERWAGRLLMVLRGSIRIGERDGNREDDLVLENLSARFTDEKFEYLFFIDPENWVIAELTTDGVIAIRDSEYTWLCSNSSCER